MNAALIMRSCRSDGVLLKTDVPLATLDAAFLGDNFDGHRSPAHIWGTYSQLGPLRWSYILSVSTTSALTMTLKELDTPPGLDYVLLDFWATNGSSVPSAASMTRISSAGAASFVVPKSPPVPDGNSDKGTYQILAPVLSNGWCLLGEALKVVTASRRRFGEVTEMADRGMKVSVKAAAGETVVLLVVPPLKQQQQQQGDAAVMEVHCDTAHMCSGADCDISMELVCEGGGAAGTASCKCTPTP
jgi:hypothetical protein